MAEPGVIVIGAGPAGVRAAEELVAAGLRPIVIDEGRRDGGQIYRRQPEHFKRDYTALYGSEAQRAASVHRGFDALRGKIDYRPETLAWNIFDGHVHVVREHRTEKLPYSALVICSGATDRLMPVPGWELSGVYSLGASQIALKSAWCSSAAGRCSTWWPTST
jgi:NADPH-dependent 2,4-dienoyl-CoA reductase/sulfur reductase-like enzyme